LSVERFFYTPLFRSKGAVVSIDFRFTRVRTTIIIRPENQRARVFIDCLQSANAFRLVERGRALVSVNRVGRALLAAAGCFRPNLGNESPGATSARFCCALSFVTAGLDRVQKTNRSTTRYGIVNSLIDARERFTGVRDFLKKKKIRPPPPKRNYARKTRRRRPFSIVERVYRWIMLVARNERISGNPTRVVCLSVRIRS